MEYTEERLTEGQHIEKRFQEALTTKSSEWAPMYHLDIETSTCIQKLYDMKRKYEEYLLNDFDTASALHVLLQVVHELHIWKEEHQNDSIIPMLTSDFLNTS